MLKQLRLTPEGYLESRETPIARAGIQIYQNSDGTITREYRPHKEVSAIASIESFRLVPVTLEHPPGLIDSRTARAYQVGVTSDSVKYDRGFVKTTIKITDFDTIEKIKASGIHYLSAGYRCKIIREPGYFDGEPYDCIQSEIRGNHVAVVSNPRGGKELSLRFDANTALKTETIKQVIRLDNSYVIAMNTDEATREELLTYIEELSGRLEKSESERTDALEAAGFYEGKLVQTQEKIKELESVSSRVDSGESEKLRERLSEKQMQIDDLRERLDEANGTAQLLKTELSTLRASKERLESEIKTEKESRMDAIASSKIDYLRAITRASAFLPSGFRKEPDVSMSPTQVYRLAIETSLPTVKLDSDEPQYIEGMFKILEAQGTPSNNGRDLLKSQINSSMRTDASGVASLEGLKQKRQQESIEAWKVQN